MIASGAGARGVIMGTHSSSLAIHNPLVTAARDLVGYSCSKASTEKEHVVYLGVVQLVLVAICQILLASFSKARNLLSSLTVMSVDTVGRQIF